MSRFDYCCGLSWCLLCVCVSVSAARRRSAAEQLYMQRRRTFSSAPSMRTAPPVAHGNPSRIRNFAVNQRMTLCNRSVPVEGECARGFILNHRGRDREGGPFRSPARTVSV